MSPRFSAPCALLLLIACAVPATVEEDPLIARTKAFRGAREHRPDELAYLMPEGRLDPGGDRPERWKALLIAWRATAGQPPVEFAAR